jgi:hypothetical protein
MMWVGEPEAVTLVDDALDGEPAGKDVGRIAAVERGVEAGAVGRAGVEPGLGQQPVQFGVAVRALGRGDEHAVRGEASADFGDRRRWCR